jgi:hypothetical protein
MTVFSTYISVALSGLVVALLTIGPKILGFKLGRERLIFKGDKNP